MNRVLSITLTVVVLGGGISLGWMSKGISHTFFIILRSSWFIPMESIIFRRWDTLLVLDIVFSQDSLFLTGSDRMLFIAVLNRKFHLGDIPVIHMLKV